MNALGDWPGADDDEDALAALSSRKLTEDYALPNQGFDYNAKTRGAIIATARQEKIVFGYFNSKLFSQHPTVKTLRKITDDVGRVLGLDMSSFEIVVYRSDVPNASISPFTREIRIASDLLECLDWNYELVRAVIGHEAGHLLLAHAGQDEERHDEISQADPLRHRVMKYEDEYQADRVGTFVQYRLGGDCSAMRRALEKLEERLQNIAKDLKLHTTTLPWILGTHPHTPRRQVALKRLERLLPTRPPSGKKIPLASSATDFGPLLIEKLSYHLMVDRVAGRITIVGPRDFDEMPSPHDHPSSNRETNIDVLWGETQTPDKDVICLAATATDEKFSPASLEFVPDDVESLAKSGDQLRIERWWDQALWLLVTKDGQFDLATDIAQYSWTACEGLLKGLNVVRYYISIHWDPWDEDEAEAGGSENVYNMMFCILIGDDRDLYPPQLRMLTSLLFGQWFRKSPEIQTEEGLKQLLDFLRQYRQRTGVYMPYDQARVIRLCVELFAKAEEVDKGRLVELFDSYAQEIVRGNEGADGLAKACFKPILDWLEKHPEQKGFSWFFFGRRTKKDVAEITLKAKKLAYDERASHENIRTFLNEIRGVLAHSNWTETVINRSSELWKLYKDPRKRSEDSEFERIREADPRVAAQLLTSKEFEKAYFGKGRGSTSKSVYGSLEEGEEIYEEIRRLWDRSGYADEAKAITGSADLAKFVIDHFPAVCCERDKVLVTALCWNHLMYVDDVLKVKKDIDRCHDVALLCALGRGFADPYLRLMCCQRLWNIYEDGANAFFKLVPEDIKGEARQRLGNAIAGQADSRLLAIMVCYYWPSYLRDELIRTYVDDAPDEKSTMAFAALLSEPPPGVIGRRRESLVATTESLMDALRSMSLLDKQEVLLYLVGFRSFYSGIDARFPGTRRGNEEELRAKVMFKGLKRMEEDAGAKYLVEEPDAVVLLSKYSGTPVDLIIHQERMLTTRREELDLLTEVLVGPQGVLQDEWTKKDFLMAVARTLVHRGEACRSMNDEEKESVVELLGFALQHCPESKIPNLFLDIWHISSESKTSLPQLTAQLFREYGPVFVKAGQYLATQTTSLPPAWTKAFRSLANKNAAAEKTLLYEYESKAYGQGSPFEILGRKRGEGSMAAVYDGRLKSGLAVAVKIPHPFLEAEIDVDCRFLDKLVRFINQNSGRYGGVILPTNLATVTKKHMIEEADPLLEAGKHKELVAIIAPELAGVRFTVPRLVEEACQGNFLVTELRTGLAIDDDSAMAKTGIDPTMVRQALAIEILRQIVTVGTYQADANPGNFAVTLAEDGTPEAFWYDPGHLGRLDEPSRALLKKLVFGLMSGATPDNVADIISQMTQEKKRVSRECVKAMLLEWLNENLPSFSGVENAQQLLSSLLDFLAEKKLLLKEQWVVLLRTIGLMQPLLTDIKPAVVASTLLPWITEL